MGGCDTLADDVDIFVIEHDAKMSAAGQMPLGEAQQPVRLSQVHHGGLIDRGPPTDYFAGIVMDFLWRDLVHLSLVKNQVSHIVFGSPVRVQIIEGDQVRFMAKKVPSSQLWSASVSPYPITQDRFVHRRRSALLVLERLTAADRSARSPAPIRRTRIRARGAAARGRRSGSAPHGRARTRAKRGCACRRACAGAA